MKTNLLLTLSAVALTATAANAAITFQNAVTMSADSDVVTTGSLVQATNFSKTNATVNGVEFEANFDSIPFVIGNFTFTGGGTNPGANKSVYNNGTGAHGALSTDYRNNNQGGTFSYLGGAGEPSFNVALTGLQQNHDYLVQVWVADPRGGPTPTRTQTIVGDNSVDMDFNSTNAEGGTGQFVVGVFSTGQTTSDSFSVEQNVGEIVQINSMQLRDLGRTEDIPEPTSTALLGLAGIAFIFRRRK